MNQPESHRSKHDSIDVLDSAIVNLSCKINAATYELLVLIREFDERSGFLKWGLPNCTQWLHWRCDLGLSAAREKVRVAHAIKNLPKLSAAFADGRLSYSKVRALTRVAGPLNEQELLDFAMTTTASRVEERCRQMRNVQPDATTAANRVYQARSLQIWRNAERGTLTLTVELPLEEGELVSQAIEKAAQNDVSNGPEFEAQTWAAQQADALVAIAKQHIRGVADKSSSSADHYQVMIHVDQDALTKGEGRSDLPVESVKRLTCDGSVIGIVEKADGEPIRLGRKQRTVSPALKRALWARDKCCRFPGCNNTRYVDAHHVKHWSAGGETNLDNTILLCSRHHRLFHEGGFTICTDEQGRWYFRRPDGRAVPASGYQPADYIDDDIGDPSAEGFQDWITAKWTNGVAETACRYQWTNRIDDDPDDPSAEGFQDWITDQRTNAVRETAVDYRC